MSKTDTIKLYICSLIVKMVKLESQGRDIEATKIMEFIEMLQQRYINN